MQQREQEHTTFEGDLTVTGHLYVGREINGLTITNVIEGMTGRTVFFDNGTHRNFRYARRVNT
ncbi:hypothetical protein [Streptomyces sp. KAU_LT]|uniref:hypothetical protein n=1 Tax=Streptomyces sp. KAU_LT TaxID=3046669 RepID=UPI0024B858B2|nr:hypothetical protein [Streptomyces sp. KAU_LT]MDI9829723.1 hypothetical protein [Streptomyces sp. KAU_LT]